MGTRINKIIGCALTDLENYNYEINDKRVNKDGVFCNYEKEYKNKDFINFLKNKKTYDASLEISILLNLKKNKIDINISRCFIYDGESGLKNVLIVIPPIYYHEWVRYNDIIDYTEELIRFKSKKDQKSINYVQEIPKDFFY